MCGFTGIWNFEGKPVDVNRIVSMNTIIRHRGPDDEGYLLVNTDSHRTIQCHGKETIPEVRANSVNIIYSEPANLGIGFRRLSIIDLSATGHQPMQDDSGRYWIVLNGEIYNYIEIREKLVSTGISFCSQSDTEVVLKSYIHWGKNCLQHFNGMWAFVIFDSKENRLFCSRDRFGVKPLYYYYIPGKKFVFASEIKAILEDAEAVADRQSILDLFTTSYMDHTSRTFFKNILQLKPSHNLEIIDGKLTETRYYSVNVTASSTDFKTARDQFLWTLKDAVRIRMRSDVPLGFALSGGVDSSSIIALARDIYPSYDINAFSLAYPGKSVDESYYIRKVTEKLSVKQFALSPSYYDLVESMDQFVWHQEEPNNGSSYWGEFRLREFIKQHGITVSLDGQGADEIITGYPYFIESYLSDLLAGFRLRTFCKEAASFRYLFNKSLPEHIRAIISGYVRGKDAPRRVMPEYLNREYFSGVEFQDDIIQNNFVGSRLNKSLYKALTHSSVPAQLTRADKSAMAFSVECRFPFLDYRLVELAFTLPGEFKLHQGITKLILRESVKGLIPDEVYNRRDKIGFATPQKEWFSGTLRSWIKEIVCSSATSGSSLFNDSVLSKIPEKDISSIPDYRLWAIVMCYSWIQKFRVSLK